MTRAHRLVRHLVLWKMNSPTSPIDTHFDAPQLIVAIDAEEAFDWRFFSSDNTLVDCTKDIFKVQPLFERFGLTPSYMIDYPVADQPEGQGPLLELFQDNKCELGAQLHPWVTPPIDERVSRKSSYTCNLPRDLIERKIASLTGRIEAVFGGRPRSFRTGRYGVSPEIWEILIEQGYLIDMSILPHIDLRPDDGPDFRAYSPRSFWIDPEKKLLEIPVTAGLTGPMKSIGSQLHPVLSKGLLRRIHAQGIFARSGLLNRAMLSPEGNPVKEAINLVHSLHRTGQNIFAVSFHSSSLSPGNSPYCKTEDDVARLLVWLETFFEFFFSDMKGVATTPSQIYASLKSQKKDPLSKVA